MNIKELKEYIKDLPDDMEVAYWKSKNYWIVDSFRIEEQKSQQYIENRPYIREIGKQKLLIIE